METIQERLTGIRNEYASIVPDIVIVVNTSRSMLKRGLDTIQTRVTNVLAGLPNDARVALIVFYDTYDFASAQVVNDFIPVHSVSNHPCWQPVKNGGSGDSSAALTRAMGKIETLSWSLAARRREVIVITDREPRCCPIELPTTTTISYRTAVTCAI
jgi:hypothetical protein